MDGALVVFGVQLPDIAIHGAIGVEEVEGSPASFAIAPDRFRPELIRVHCTRFVQLYMNHLQL